MITKNFVHVEKKLLLDIAVKAKNYAMGGKGLF